MLQRFKEEHIHIQSVHYCPHAPEAQCNCRKPQIGMIEQIVKAYPVELSKSWMIGDKQSDIDLAHNAKIKRSIAIGKRPIQGANYYFATIDDCKAYFEKNPKSLD
jgi:D-glycero-D-manno-heptose 1,7-bisphosphate phosphatase